MHAVDHEMVSQVEVIQNFYQPSKIQFGGIAQTAIEIIHNYLNQSDL